ERRSPLARSRCGSGADLEIFAFGELLEAGAGQLPSFVLERHGACAFAFASIDAGGAVAASLPFAVVEPVAGMALGGGTGAFPTASILVILALAFADVQSPADVRIASHE